jgi:hypothetical protein
MNDKTTVTNNFDLSFKIGGVSPNLPRVEMTMLNCHVELPAHAIDDVISLETSFHALPSKIDLTQPPFSPIRSGPKAASKPSRQKQFPSSSE